MNTESTDDGPQQAIQSIEVGVLVLYALETGRGPLALSEIARRSDMHPTRVHRRLIPRVRVGLAGWDGTEAAAQRVLAETDRPLPERLLESFDWWAGRYIGPLTQDIASVIGDNPDLLATILETAPRRFEGLVTAAIAVEHGHRSARAMAKTLISTSIGIKHQVGTRDAYLERLEVAVDLFLH